MVATRGIIPIQNSINVDIVEFVTGRGKLDPSDIRVDHWISILRAAIKELPINYMRGLKSIKQILQYDGSHAIAREVESPLPRLWPEGVDKHDGTEIRPNAVFLDCADTGGGFPQGKWVHETYPKAPRKPYDQNGDDESFLPLDTGHFLLSRSRTLYYLSVTWRAKTVWDQKSTSSMPAEFWYQADLSTLKIVHVDDQKLENLLAAISGRNVALVMLQRFNLAMIETTGDARSQYDHIQEKRQVIGGYLDRVGQLAH